MQGWPRNSVALLFVYTYGMRGNDNVTGRGYNSHVNSWSILYVNVQVHACSSSYSMSWVTLTVLLVLGSCNWTPASGQTCSLSGS